MQIGKMKPKYGGNFSVQERKLVLISDGVSQEWHSGTKPLKLLAKLVIVWGYHAKHEAKILLKKLFQFFSLQPRAPNHQ